MNTIPIKLNDLKKSFLLNEGVYAGDLFDFLKENELWYLQDIISEIKEYSVKERDKLMCRYDYTLLNENGINENDGFEHTIPLSDVLDRDVFVRENNREITQKWLEFEGFNDRCNFFIEISKRILDFFYSDIEIEYYQIPHFALYEDGHFIQEHNDGKNIGRVCGLIIYLSDEDDYKNEGGGELVVHTNSKKIYEISPVFGTFTLLDFTKNNIRHSVNEVKNGFKRYSFIYFFYEKQKEVIKKIKLI